MANLSKVKQFVEALEHNFSEIDDSFIVSDPESAFGGETNGSSCSATTNDGNCKNTGDCSSTTNGGRCQNKALEDDKKSSLPSF